MHHKGYKAEEVEVVNEVSKKTLSSYVKKAATEIGTSATKGDYKKMQKRHKGVLDASDKLAKEEVGITTHSMMMKDKAKKEAMLRMKERDAVAKKLRKEERDEYGDPMGGPKISKKEVKKNLAKNEPDKQHTTDTSEGMAYGITRGSGKPSGQMAAFGKEKKKENPYSLKNKIKMVIKSVAEKERAKAGVTKEDVIPEAKYEAGASTYGKATIRNKRKFGTSGELPDPLTGKKITKDATRGELIAKRREEHKAKRGVKEEVGIATHSMMMKDKAKKEAMLRKKERDAVAKKLRKEERDEYGDPVGGPKISKKQKEKNLKANTPDEQHTTTTSEGYGSDRVGPALTMARAIDKVNPRPKPNSKRTRVSRALKLASIKKDEKIRKRQEIHTQQIKD